MAHSEGKNHAAQRRKQAEELEHINQTITSGIREREQLRVSHFVERAGQSFDEFQDRKDAEEKARLTASSSAGTSASIPQPSGTGGAADVGKSNRSSLSDFLGEFQETGDSTTTDIPRNDKSGLIDSTTSTDFQKQFGGRFGQALRIFDPDALTKTETRKTTSTKRDPNHVKRMELRANQMAESLVDRGTLDPGMMKQITERFNPQDRAQILADMRAQVPGILKAEQDQKFAEGKSMYLAAIGNGWNVTPESSKLFFDLGEADTPAEIGGLTTQLANLANGSPKAQTEAISLERAKAGLLDDSADRRLRAIQFQVANNKILEYEAGQQQANAQAEVKGLLGSVSLSSNMTAQQRFDGAKGLNWNVKDGVKVDANARGLMTTIQLEQLAVDGNINLVTDNWIGSDQISSHRNRDILNDLLAFGVPIEGLEPRGFRADGSVALSPDEVDVKVTEDVRVAAAGRLTKLGFVTEANPDGSTGLGIQEDSNNATALGGVLRFAGAIRGKEMENKIYIENPYEWQPVEGFAEGADFEVEVGAAPIPSGPDPLSVTGIAKSKTRRGGAYTRGFFSQALETAKTQGSRLIEPVVEGGKFAGEIGSSFLEGLIEEGK